MLAQPTQWRGAVVQRAAVQAIPTGVATVVSFDTIVKNTPICFVAASPTRLTVPAGVDEVILTGRALFAFNIVGDRGIAVTKNGLSWDLSFYDSKPTVTGAGVGSGVNGQTAPVPVVPGDFFELLVDQDSGGALAVLAWCSMTFF